MTRPDVPMPISVLCAEGNGGHEAVAPDCKRDRVLRRAGPCHPPAALARVLATLRRSLREGTPWRGLRASADQASGSTLRRCLARCLARWMRSGLLVRVHAMLVAMRRGNPALRSDGCSARPKRGPSAAGTTDPNPTERAKKGTKDHLAATGTAFRPRAQQQQPT